MVLLLQLVLFHLLAPSVQLALFHQSVQLVLLALFHQLVQWVLLAQLALSHLYLSHYLLYLEAPSHLLRPFVLFLPSVQWSLCHLVVQLALYYLLAQLVLFHLLALLLQLDLSHP